MSMTGPIRRRGGRGKCLACASEQRAEIDAAIVAGASMRGLEKQFEISATALRSHKRDHLSPALVAVARRQGSRSVVTLVDRLRGLVDQAELVLAAALKSGNGSQALAAIREVRATLEIVGRATGELKERSAVAVNVQTSPEWATMRAAIVEAVPAAIRHEVAAKLQALEKRDS